MKAVILILLLATTAFALPVYMGMSSYGIKYSTNTPLGSNLTNLPLGTVAPIAKTYNNRIPVVQQPSAFNPNRNVIHSNVTLQTWDYRGYCIDQPKSVQLKATKLSCSYQKQDRQWNSWSCANGGYLRCVGTSCPKNTCRVPGVRVS